MFCSKLSSSLYHSNPFIRFLKIPVSSTFKKIQHGADSMLYVAVLLRSDIVTRHIVSKERDGDRQAVSKPQRPASNSGGRGSLNALYVDRGHLPYRLEMREGRRLERRDDV